MSRLNCVGFCGGRKTGEPREKPLEQGTTNNKLNPHVTPSCWALRRAKPFFGNTAVHLKQKLKEHIICLGFFVEDMVAQWLVRRTWDQTVESSSPGRCTHIVFLGKTPNSHSTSLHPGV